MDKDDVELNALVKSQVTYYEAPHGLHKRIGLALEQADMPKAKLGGWPSWQKWRGMSAAFAAGLLLAVAGMFIGGRLGQQDQLVAQVVDSHVRSLMVAHLSDVTSSDRHTVKPWFDGKLNYSPPVSDLAPEGFPLVGGRMDYIDGRPVAALVYRHRLHAINVFVWPERSGSFVLSASTSRRGFNVESWQADGMEFWAVSDVQPADLERFEQLLRGAESVH